MTDQTELDALVVRHIGDIEGAMKHAIEQVGPRLWDETADALNETIDTAVWTVAANPGEEEIWFADRAWMAPDSDPSDPEANVWFAVEERLGGGGDGEHSWLATFLAVGPNGAGMALALRQDILSASAWKKLLKANHEMVDAIVIDRLMYDSAKSLFYVPFRIDGEKLATAFEEEDFQKAFEPLVEAARVAVASAPRLAPLLNAARALAG